MKRLASATALVLCLWTTQAAAQTTTVSDPDAAAPPVDAAAPEATPPPALPPPVPAPEVATPAATVPAPSAAPAPTPPASSPVAPATASTAPPPPPETASPTATPTPHGPRTAVIDAAPIGVDAAAARFVTETIRTTVAQLGFSIVPTADLYAAARRLSLPFPVPADGVFLLERALQTPVAITAEVRAAHRMYIVRIRVRVAVEAMERVREVSANQWQLAEALRGALPALLVPPQPGAVATQTAPAEELPLPAIVPRRHYRAHPRHWEIGGGLDVAFGPGDNSFVNYLVEARLGWFPMDRLGFSLTGAYGNLAGRQGRVNNFLTMAGIETAIDLVPSSHIFIPLRAEVGYLPNNGPVLRLTAGISFQLARHVHLEIDILSPTLWILPETAPVSLDLAATLHFGL